MEKPSVDAVEPTYPLGAAARLTGLSPELLRAWERRYRVVEPLRTTGGTRRYRAADLERLRLLKAAVDAGHRIGQVAHLELSELERRARADEPAAPGYSEEALRALERLDGSEAHRLLSLQLAALGPVRFARDVAHPLVQEIGQRWASGRLPIAAEHLATSVLRTLLGAALQPSAASLRGPKIVFATPPGEPHDLGLQMAALTALGAGAHPLFLGPELPAADLLVAVARTRAAVLALGLVTLPVDEAARTVAGLRERLASATHLWLGGRGARALELPPGTERIDSLESLERRVLLLCLEVE